MNEPTTPVNTPGHEMTDAPVLPIMLMGVGTALIVALSLIFCIGVFRFFASSPTETPANPMATDAPQFPPTPRIEVAPSLEFRQLRSDEDQILSTYGWVDRKAGTARIPIDRAIDLELQRGFSVRKEGPKK